MEIYICKYCNSATFTAERSGKHVKLLCAECGKYQQFIPQSEPDTGQLASSAQQEYAISLIKTWRANGKAMTVLQAAAIIKSFKENRDAG